MLIQLSLIVTALLVVGYIVGSEMCLPGARHALRTGNLQLWKTACFLVTLGEWAMIFIVLSFLLLAEHIWHLFTGAWHIRLAGLLLAGILAGVTVWELVWRTRRNYARVMSSALDLVLPAHGVQRDIYLSRRWLLESGSAAEQEHVLQHLFHETRSSAVKPSRM
jgi:uncharacterized protein YacL